MKRTVVLLLLLALCATVSAKKKPAPGPGPGAGCMDHKDAKSCDKDKACTWCQGKTKSGPTPSCYTADSAQWLPKNIFKCDKKAALEDRKVELKVAKKTDKCKDLAKTDCKGECVWCTGAMKGVDIDPVCMPEVAADWLPKTVYDCKASKDAEEFTVSKKKKAKCGKLAKEDCTGDCTWCTGEMTGIPDLCFPDVASDWLPKTVFKCKADEDADDDQGDDSDVLTKAGAKNKCKDLAQADCTGECVWCTGVKKGVPGVCLPEKKIDWVPKTIYDCKADKQDTDDDTVLSMSKKSDAKTKCGKLAKDDCTGDCTWCTGEMTGIPDLCFPDVASDWLPKTVFKCKADKDADDTSVTVSKKKDDDMTKCAMLAKDDCTGACTWCTGEMTGVPDFCFPDMASDWLPKNVYECKADKDSDDDQDDDDDDEDEDDEDDTVLSVSKKSDAKTKCGKLAKDDCTGDCTWCTGEMTGIPDLCFPDVASDWLPKTVFKCKADKDTDDDQGDDSDVLTKAAKKSDKCKDLAEKDCKGDCTWCTGEMKGLPGMCFSEAASAWLPETVFKCKASKKDTDTDSDASSVLLRVAQKVMKVVMPAAVNIECDKLGEKQCIGECVWCTSAAVGASCYSTEQAKMLPSAVFKCKSAPSQAVV